MRFPVNPFPAKCKPLAARRPTNFGTITPSARKIVPQDAKTDARLRPGFAVRLGILGDNLSRAVSIPGEAVFEHDGKKVVYCKRNRGFEMQEVKVRALSEGRAILDGISPGTIVALVNPEKNGAGKEKGSNASNPSFGPGSK